MKLDFDTTDFDKTFKRYLKVNRRASEELINKKAMQCAAVAVNRTPVAGGGKTVAQGRRSIRRELKRPRNDGNDKGRQRWKNLGEAIIQQAKFKRTGRYYSDAELKTELEKLINLRSDKVGFLKSGWFPALKILNREAWKNKYVSKDFIDTYVAKERQKSATAGYGRGRDKGTASPATRLKLMASISNSVQPGYKQRAAALISALNYVKRDMVQYIARKHKQVLEGFK
jgi:hypothetical protein